VPASLIGRTQRAGKAASVIDLVEQDLYPPRVSIHKVELDLLGGVPGRGRVCYHSLGIVQVVGLPAHRATWVAMDPL
jgi:hypothetical protein